MTEEATKELLYKIADDQLVLGHRNSEWTGFGPLLEEDIAFSSMAQDKLGQSLVLYQLLHQLGEAPPDTVAFMRDSTSFHNCIFTELPNGEYDFSLVRHFLFDTAEKLRFEMLRESTFIALAELAVKISGELRYHDLHARTWMKQLGSATEESILRLQQSLTFSLPYALGIFEVSPYEEELTSEKIFAGEKILRDRWMERVEETLKKTELRLPQWESINPVFGGRAGNHSEHLQPLLDEMSEVFKIDPNAEW
ncbi:MAG TPA: 1,2-phenylacetyl-CoA epoxidase subunit PaaC [Chryseolinea sp.]|nr:1,2-phenylacetyl-CoA epoxidase subunit PaaC [Chryseolinea sp.]